MLSSDRIYFYFNNCNVLTLFITFFSYLLLRLNKSYGKIDQYVRFQFVFLGFKRYYIVSIRSQHQPCIINFEVWKAFSLHSQNTDALHRRLRENIVIAIVAVSCIA